MKKERALCRKLPLGSRAGRPAATRRPVCGPGVRPRVSGSGANACRIALNSHGQRSPRRTAGVARMNAPETAARVAPDGPAPDGPERDRLRNAAVVRRMLLGGAGLRERLQEIATRSGASLPQLVREAGRYLREMVPGNSALGYRLLIRFSRFFYQRGYDRQILCDPAEIERLRVLISQHPVALISNHRSQVDGFAVYCALHDNRLPHPFAFGGINMKLPVMGPILKGSGLVFLRRSFQDNPVYKAVLRSYIDFLTEHRFPLLWAIEGTRSRTGKRSSEGAKQRSPRASSMTWHPVV